MKYLILTTISAVMLVGCDPHVDSVYLGRAESKMLGEVSAGNIVIVKKFLDKGGILLAAAATVASATAAALLSLSARSSSTS